MRFPVDPHKEKALVERMERAGLREEDLAEKFIRGRGPGGQKINRTSCCVQLRHEPSGIEVKCQKTRSQALNRFFARRRLCERIEKRFALEESEEQKRVEKLRRQKRKRSQRAKEKMLEGKKRVSERKRRRARVESED